MRLNQFASTLVLLLILASPAFCADEAATLYEKAQGLYQQGRYIAAAKTCRDLIEEFPRAELTAEQAQFLEAEAYLKAQRPGHAYVLFQRLLKDFPRTEYFDEILDREYTIGDMFCSGFKRKFLGMRLVTAGSYGVEILENVISNAPRSDYAPRARLRIAQYYFRTTKFKDTDQIHRHCDLLILEYPGTDQAAEARLLKAETARRAIKGPKYNAGDLTAAKTALLRAKSIDKGGLTEDKIDEALARIHLEQVENDYETAKFYLRQGQSVAAAICLEAVIERAPDSEYARYARRGLAKLGQSGADTK